MVTNSFYIESYFNNKTDQELSFENYMKNQIPKECDYARILKSKRIDALAN
jgi:hypothetical protein